MKKKKTNCRLIVSVPFPPETKGAAESGVKLKKIKLKISTTQVQKRLLLYRNTSHRIIRSQTKIPAKLLMNYRIGTHFDALISNNEDVVRDKQTSKIKQLRPRQ